MACFRHRLNDVIDVVDRVADAGVLGFRRIVKIDRAVGTHRYVLQQRIATDGLVDIRLRFCRQTNGLGVAAAFEVEHAVIIPAVLVVANQAAFRIGGEGGFTGAGQAEEHRHVAFLANVRRAVHGGNAL